MHKTNVFLFHTLLPVFGHNQDKEGMYVQSCSERGQAGIVSYLPSAPVITLVRRTSPSCTCHHPPDAVQPPSRDRYTLEHQKTNSI